MPEETENEMRRQRAIVANLGKERSTLMSRVDSASRPTKYNPSGRRQSSLCRHRHMATRVASALALAFIFGWNNMKPSVERIMTEHTIRTSTTTQRTEMGRIIYGAKSKGEDTARLVTQAIQSGFRHIATGGFHSEYNESGVGVGWKESGIPRHELYLQTLFVERSVNGYGTQNCNGDKNSVCPPLPNATIEDQVHASVKSSLRNLQTDYIDAVLVHNFRAKLQPYNDTMQAWKVLEDYVDRGVIRQLGIVSVHDKDFLTKLHDETRIKPSVIQNRFHSNRGYDTELRSSFKGWGVANQLFWILTGSAGGRVRKNGVVKGIAEMMGGVSPQILLYSFTMELGGSPLIGTQNISHMQEDVDALIRHRMKWEKADLVAMAAQIDKNLAAKIDKNLV